tara:strand:- start:1809 stop:2243 length:435 start_codon:yes stop_codon:yes gene_type:complete
MNDKKEQIDILGTHFYHGYADKKGDRAEELKQQRLSRGFDDTELWDLFSTIAQFIEPRLKEFVKMDKMGIPGMIMDDEDLQNDSGITDETEEKYTKKWDEILRKMHRAFELILEDNVFSNQDPKMKEIEEGLELFAKYFQCLWD